MSEYSPQTKTLIILPKVTGGLSMLGSGYIFQDVVRTHKKRGNSVYHRILIGMSIFDFIASLMNFLSSWPTPVYTGVYLAAGNTQTCTAAGFFNELGNTVTPTYNASLCIYYVLIIRKGWNEGKIRRYEALFHLFPQFIGWTFSLVALGFLTYNPAGWNCWLAAYPNGCLSDGTCTRGEHVLIFRWAHYAIIWGAVFVVSAGMVVIWYSVYKQEQATKQFTTHRRGSVAAPNTSPHAFRASGDMLVNGASPDNNLARTVGTQREPKAPTSKARKVMMQAFYFCGAMYLTWIFTTVTRLIQVSGGKPPFPLMVFQVIFFPLQGFFNCFIYLRPRYLRLKAKHPNISCIELMKQVFFPSEQVREKSQRPTSELHKRTSSFISKSFKALRMSIGSMGGGSEHDGKFRRSNGSYGNGSNGDVANGDEKNGRNNQNSGVTANIEKANDGGDTMVANRMEKQEESPGISEKSNGSVAGENAAMTNNSFADNETPKKSEHDVEGAPLDKQETANNKNYDSDEDSDEDRY